MMIDLHCHTKKSDNSMEIKDIIRLAKKKGVTHLAITDHDTTEGIEEATQLGEIMDIEIIPGIEISAYDYYKDKKVHILGYFIDPNNEMLKAFCTPINARRNEEAKIIVEQIMKYGFDITWNEVKKLSLGSICVNKKHIMHALIEKGYCNNICCDIYENIVQGIQPISMEYADVEEAIRIIKIAGGVPVLAHPGVFDNFSSVEKWIELGLEGIEIFHPSHTDRDIRKCKIITKKYNLLETGGSDFHGVYGYSEPRIGCNEVSIRIISQLKERVEKIKCKLRAV